MHWEGSCLENKCFEPTFFQRGASSHAVILAHNHVHWFLPCQKIKLALTQAQTLILIQILVDMFTSKTLYFVISQHRSKVLCVCVCVCFATSFHKSLPCHAILKCDDLLLFIRMPRCLFFYCFSDSALPIFFTYWTLTFTSISRLNLPYTTYYLPAWVNHSLC